MNREGIEKLEAQVDSLVTLMMRSYAQFLFLRPMMVNYELIARMGTEGKRSGFEQLRSILYWNFIQELVKICDDQDKRTPSIKRIIDKLDNNSLKKDLEDKYSKSALPRIEGEDYDAWKALRDQEENELRVKFRNIFERLKNNSKELLSSTTLSGYKEIRDKLIAHNELRKSEDEYKLFDIGILNLEYGNERELLEKAKDIIDDLNSVVRNAGFSWDSLYEIESRDICKFWDIEKIE